jgi:probable phosphoglycerate mutase
MLLARGQDHVRRSTGHDPERPWAIGSDTWSSYLRRATAFLAEFIEHHEGQRIVLAAHGETVIALHTLLLDLPHGASAGFVTDHGGLTRWQRHRNRFGERRWMLAAHNDTAHLKAAEC